MAVARITLWLTLGVAAACDYTIGRETRLTSARCPPGSAFCETFSQPQPGGRGGDLDERVINFSRWSHTALGSWVRQPASTRVDLQYPATFCGAPFSGLLPGTDSRVCDGQLDEVLEDGQAFAVNALRIRQPF